MRTCRHLSLTVPGAVKENPPTCGVNRQYFPRYGGILASEMLRVTTSQLGLMSTTNGDGTSPASDSFVASLNSKCLGQLMMYVSR